MGDLRRPWPKAMPALDWYQCGEETGGYVKLSTHDWELAAASVNACVVDGKSIRNLTHLPTIIRLARKMESEPGHVTAADWCELDAAVRSLDMEPEVRDGNL